MGYTATNTGSAALPFRDDAGKHFVAPGDSLVISGDQHHAAVSAAGLEVVWVQNHKEIEATERRIEALAATAATAAESTEQSEPESKPKRKASVTARER